MSEIVRCPSCGAIGERLIGYYFIHGRQDVDGTGYRFAENGLERRGSETHWECDGCGRKWISRKPIARWEADR